VGECTVDAWSLDRRPGTLRRRGPTTACNGRRCAPPLMLDVRPLDAAIPHKDNAPSIISATHNAVSQSGI